LDVSSGLACFWSCGLVIMLDGCLELAQKLIWASQNFPHPTHHPNQPAARLRANGFPSQPSQIMHWMYQVSWHVFEAVVRSLWRLDILNWIMSWFGWAKFSSSHTNQTSLLQDLDPVDSLPNHPKPCIGSIKWLGMFLKLWFGH
jgi:hypothetical protein